MTNFGFSAFLRLVHLNERPKRTELRKRLRGSSGSGYDYHRSLRVRAGRLLHEGVPLAEVLRSKMDIKKPAERTSAISGLENLQVWVAANVTEVYGANKLTLASPSELYKVNYLPDFAATVGGRRTMVHIWNTMKPDLARRLVLPSLAPFWELAAEDGFEAVAVLSLRDGLLYSVHDSAEYQEHAAVIYENMEHIIEDIIDDGPRGPAEDRPVV